MSQSNHTPWRRMSMYLINYLIEHFKIFRHLFDCASLCSNHDECSAFHFNAEEKNCILGSKVGIEISANKANSILVHINPGYTSIGKLIPNILYIF
jgi:hypothetical protein